MGENIQCPVCTLYLHAGMDLSVHLETHPKEQVIKALVQLTVSKGNDEAVTALSSALKVENDKNAKVETSEAAVPINFTTNFAQNRSQKSTLHATSSSITETNNAVVDANTQNVAACREVDADDGLKHAYQQMDTYANRFQQLQPQQQPQQMTSEQQHSALPTSQQQKQTAAFSHENNQLQEQQPQQQQQEQPTAHVGNNEFSLNAHRSVLPPPPPPPPVPPANSTALPPATTQSTQSTHMFAALQQQQQQQNNQQHALLTQQQQNLKIVYSPILPAPPLQLYSYQAAAHNTTHQKPPPAYVTAISQIRSQNNNHNKQFQQQQLQNASMAVTSPPQQLHRQQQQQELQQHNVRALATTNTKQTIYADQQQSNPATPPPPTATSTQTTIVMNATDYQQLNEQVNLPHYHTQLTQEQHEQQQYHAFNYKVPTTNTVQQMGNGISPTTTTTTANSSFNADATNNVSKPFPPPVRPLSRPQSAYTPTFRQTNSPYPFTAPSPAPSVLRYAESPVAHYLERDNGDFIVQEIPKHIVECVETDNGEFSIVERIYQSPPSVLHIHDENETEQQIEEQAAKTAAEVEKQTEAEHEAVVSTANVEEQAKEVTNKTEKTEVNEEEFMSISTDTDLESDDDASVHSKSSYKSQKKNIKAAKCNKNNNNMDDVLKSVNGLNASGTMKSKKSSKNSITVLSDVQLNLNEYLDLVGNIIASTKINGSKAFCGNIELPGVKVEKEEPYDDYEYEQLQPQQEEESTNINDKSEEIAEITTTKRINKNNNNNKNSRKTDEATYEHLTLLNSNASPMHMHVNNETEECDQSLHLVHNKTDECKENYAETSVIRMAITSQKQQEQQQQQRLKCAVIESESMEKYVAEDLSKTQIKQNNGIELKLDNEQQICPPNTNAATKATQKKGPKKLIIKPKSLKTDQKSSTTTTTIEDEVPTTSAAAVAAAQLHKCQDNSNSTATDLVVVKNEELTQQHITECEQLKDCKTEDNEIKMLKSVKEEEDKTILNVAAEDARMLLEFAHSKKHKTANSTTTTATTVENGSNFLSNISLFSNKMPNIECTTTTSSSRTISSSALRCDDEFLPLDADANQALSFAATSQEANDALAHNNEQHTFLQQQQQQHTFADYPFSFLYGAGGNAHITQQHNTEISRLANFSPGIYHQQQTNDGGGTTAATLASTSNSLAASLDDSCSTHQQQQHHFTASHWYQQQTVANADFETALAVDCNNTAVSMPDNEGTKYLDLDFCKRESSNSFAAAGTQVAALNSNATSSSFAAATDSSLAAADALNIRSDEKMPAKGEISEQESNCDVENSWSQPIYNDFTGRYFKTTFPSVFQQENGWHQDEYFTVQDLSAAAAAAAAANDNQQVKTQKSFDFRLPFEASTATSATNLQLFSQINNGNNNNNNNNNKHNDNKEHIDLTANTATTSQATKKKRKRAVANAQAKRSRPTATVTSQQLLLQQQQEQQPQQLLPFQLQIPTDSAALLAGPSTAAAAVAAMQQQQEQQLQSQIKQRKRVYQCDNCGMQFNKLKDRNSHLILMHNYIRQNRRLICVQALAGSSTSQEAMSEVMSAHAASAASSSTDIEDSKQGIVKVEMSEPQQFEQSATTSDSLDKTAATQAEQNMLEAKSEFPEDKDLLALVPFKNEAGMVINKKILKSRLLPLAATTPASKLATLYRMLVSFNMATLRRNQNLSECEEKLMETSIFFCYVCRCNFNTVKLYDAHLTEHPAECFTCGKKFQRWKNFSLHLKRHLGWKEFGCNVCDKKFVVRSALVEHMRMHTGHTPLKCKICGM